MGELIPYIDQYGYIVLFFALMLELIALPIPGQLLMSYAGFLAYQGHLNLLMSILIAWIGSCIGITTTYMIGLKLGAPFIKRNGHLFYMGPDRMEKTSAWFNKYGNLMLAFGYFIPGVKHFTGYFAGMIRLPLRTFMLFAYCGAFIWTSTFITFGRLMGPTWHLLHNSVRTYIYIAVIVGAIILIIFLYQRYRVHSK